MAIITKPTVNKGQAATFELNKAELALVASVVQSTYFSDPANWNKVSISYKSADGNQRTAVLFDATQTTPEGDFLVSEKARDSFEVQKIVIRDFDGGKHEVLRTELNAAEFDVVFNILTSYLIMVIGSNNYGELAIGGTPGSLTSPVVFTQVSSLNRYIQMSAHHFLSYAIREDGTLHCAGRNQYGELAGLVPVGIGIDSILTNYTQVGTDTDWKMVACGETYVLALKQNGTLWASGRNNFFQLGLGDQIDRNGLVQVGTATDWDYIEASSGKSFAIKTNGTLYGFGGADWGTFGNGIFASQFLQTPTQIGIDTDWKEVRTTNLLTLALKQNGVLYAAGSVPGNIPGYETRWNWINNVSILPRETFTIVPNISTVSNISKFKDASLLVVQEDGKLYGIGYNNFGQLGIGSSTVDILNFTQIGTDTDWKQASVGALSSVAIKQNGTLYAAGNANYNSIGTTTNTMTQNQDIADADEVIVHETSTYLLRDYIYVAPPVNYTNTSISGFKIGTVSPNSVDSVTDDYFGPNAYSTTSVTTSSYAPFNAFYYLSEEDANSFARSSKSNGNTSTWTNVGGAASSALSPKMMVIDLGQERTFNMARFYQTFADGKTTHIRLDVSSNGNLNTRTSPNWTPVTLTNSSGTSAGQVDLDGYLVMDDGTGTGTAANFSQITARYLRIRLYNSGVYGSPNYVELFNMKLFLI
jgi:alpha-tubulin suppressor-like RCC1 family protein